MTEEIKSRDIVKIAGRNNEFRYFLLHNYNNGSCQSSDRALIPIADISTGYPVVATQSSLYLPTETETQVVTEFYSEELSKIPEGIKYPAKEINTEGIQTLPTADELLEVRLVRSYFLDVGDFQNDEFYNVLRENKSDLAEHANGLAERLTAMRGHNGLTPVVLKKLKLLGEPELNCPDVAYEMKFDCTYVAFSGKK